MNEGFSPRGRDVPQLIGLLIFVAAFGFALLSARRYAGSWNDGAALAAAESLVDYHSFVIERSIFVHVPQKTGASPYGGDALLNRFGTRDVLLIDGRIYSAKPPVYSMLTAGVYEGARFAIGLNARQNPRRFCYLMAALTSGLAYAVAVWCIFRIGLHNGLDWSQSLLLAGSAAVATVAIAYMQAVNNHVVELAVSSAVILNMLRFLGARNAGKNGAAEILLAGGLSGLGYAIEQGSGIFLLVGVTLWSAYRTRSARMLCLFALAAAPWIVAHQAMIFALGHSLRPINSVRTYQAFAGSAFALRDMTGAVVDRPPLKTIGYMFGMLFGPRGFLGHNLALYLALPAICLLIARGERQIPELAFAACYAAGTWIVYALVSGNYSGLCCSVRWFVPLLAPGYYVLARLLKEQPEYWPDFLILSGWGVLFGIIMWWEGPWSIRSEFFCLPIQLLALASWAAYRVPRLNWARWIWLAWAK